jgi:hypothetical protein
MGLNTHAQDCASGESSKSMNRNFTIGLYI